MAISDSGAWKFAERMQLEGGSVIREIAKQVVRNPGIISFAGGLPSPDTFPVERLRQCFDSVLSRNGAIALQYSSTDGYMPLRAWLAERLRAKGMVAHPENILITSGSQQGLDLAGRVLLESDDPVYVELPTYVGATQALRAYGPKFRGVPSDEGGLIVDSLQAAASDRSSRGRPGLLYTVPNFQNPSGRTLALERREHLAKVVQNEGIVVLEDDPYGELAFDGVSPPSLCSMAPEHVIYLGSFSKILCPGIRLGFVLAPSAVVRKMELVKQGLDLHTATLTQMAIFELVRDGYLDVHLPEIRSLYARQCAVMCEAIEAYFPKGVHAPKPKGGMFMWLELPRSLDTTSMLPRALARQIAYVPGQPFHVDGEGKHTMRLSFANAREDAIRIGVERLASVIQAEMQQAESRPRESVV